MHLKDCGECKEEVALIDELTSFAVPDPGDLFWSTLPGKVTALSKERAKKKFSLDRLFRPVPAAALVCLIAVLTVVFTYTYYENGAQVDPAFTDPLSVTSLDYSLLLDDDLIAISSSLTIDLNTMEIIEYRYYSDTYHEELASLSSEEVNRLFQALINQKNNGGV
jgi:hypothetical protein